MENVWVWPCSVQHCRDFHETSCSSVLNVIVLNVSNNSCLYIFSCNEEEAYFLTRWDGINLRTTKCFTTEETPLEPKKVQSQRRPAQMWFKDLEVVDESYPRLAPDIQCGIMCASSLILNSVILLDYFYLFEFWKKQPKYQGRTVS